MIRQPERQQLDRLTVKGLHQGLIMRAKEGLAFQPEAIWAPQLAKTPVSAYQPGRKPNQGSAPCMLGGN